MASTPCNFGAINYNCFMVSMRIIWTRNIQFNRQSPIFLNYKRSENWTYYKSSKLTDDELGKVISVTICFNKKLPNFSKRFPKSSNAVIHEKWWLQTSPTFWATFVRQFFPWTFKSSPGKVQISEENSILITSIWGLNWILIWSQFWGISPKLWRRLTARQLRQFWGLFREIGFWRTIQFKSYF